MQNQRIKCSKSKNQNLNPQLVQQIKIKENEVTRKIYT
jgi:hypothetical protein